MRANEFGTNPKRPQRAGARPSRGHEPQPGYTNEEQSVEETARMSASVKLQRAFDRERSKSDASRKRGEEVMAQARTDWEKKQAAEKNKEQGVAEGAPIVVAQAPIDVRNPKKTTQPQRYMGDIVPHTKPPSTEKRGVKGRPGQRPMPKYDESVEEGLGTMPTTEYVKGIYAAAAENGMGAPDVEAVRKQMVLAANGEVDIMATMQKAFQVFQNPKFKQMLTDLDALIKQAELGQSVQEGKQKGVDGKACWKGYKRMGTKKKGGRTVDNCVKMEEQMADLEAQLLAISEEGKASRTLCASSKPDSELGASQLASCKSQGLRSRDGNKSHKLGKSPKSRVKVGGHKIKGQKYGGPLPDWS